MALAVNVDSVYTSCACNRIPHSVDWGVNNLVCYAACNAVAVYDPKFAGIGKVLSTYHNHTARVNCVRWIRHCRKIPETELLSTSSDNTAVLWSLDSDQKLHPTAQLKDHKNSVTVADGLYLPNTHLNQCNRSLIIVTGSVDSLVKIWLRQENEKNLECIQSIDFGTGFSLCVRLSYLSSTNTFHKHILLACSGDDAKIHLYANDEKNFFVKVYSLIGHEDWVQALDITVDGSGDLILASGSQDSMIRLWCIKPKQKDISCEEQLVETDIKLEEDVFTVNEMQFAVTLESVLAGHEGWIYSVQWTIESPEQDKSQKTMKLLSASLDKTMIVWSLDSQSNVWLEEMRVGEVGGNTLGFFGAVFSPDCLSILGHGYQGSLHLWSFCPEAGCWKPNVTISGHFDEVLDLQWEPKGSYLLTVSKDQTSRLHAPWIRSGYEVTWHEIARPQIHGYDMSCVAVLSCCKYASGAEEKVIRAFQSPNNFLENFEHLCKIELNKEESEDIPRGASVPALGLSNKAIYEDEVLSEERHVKDEFPSSYFVAVHLNEPPTEEHLLQNTLWPEIQKLYGHGYEIFTLAAHPKGHFLASACKATSAFHAGIIIWNTKTWQQYQVLMSHQLTVTQIAFSPCGKYILSVSRDRCWSLFEEINDKYQLIATTDKKTGIHTRIIWTCAWSSDSKIFVTGSRDGKLVAWETGPTPKHLSVLELKGESITATAFYPCVKSNTYILSVGLETGSIFIYSFDVKLFQWTALLHMDNNTSHHLAVKRLAFSAEESHLLASCGLDNTVKVYHLHFHDM